MNPLNSTIKSNLELDENLNYIFETVELSILIENEKREVVFANDLFCSLFEIKLHPTQLKNSSSLANARGFSMQFVKANEFENSIKELPHKTILVKNEKWKLRNGKTILRDYIPIFKDNTLKGHIWIYKQEKSSLPTITSYASNNFLENALHHLPGEIAIFNTQAQIIFANKAYIRSDEKRLWAKGKTLVQYFSYANLSQETAQNRIEHIAKTIEHKKAISWEEIIIAPNQKNSYQLRTCYPVFNTKNQIESIIEQSIDITNLRLLEEKLHNTTNHFFATLNSLNDIVLQTDGELKLEFVNKAWENITGQISKEFTGKSIFDLLPITRYELYGKIFAILSGEAKETNGLVSVKAKDGKEKQLKYNLQAAFNVDTGKQGVTATLSDITNQQMQETQLLELVKREKELNELKTAFVNMVSHELRTPLTVISSSAEILDLMLQAGKNREELAVYTKQIIDEVEKMTAFMQDLLMVSKIEAGKIEPNPIKTDMVQFVNEFVNNGFNPWKDGRVTEISFKGNITQAAIDSTMLQHALQNLLQNAFKYSSGKSNPKLRIAFAKTYFTISVADGGIGIPTGEIEKLFTSFFRASNTSNISGTGIGLVVAKYFTEQHKGYIAVKSAINKGSIFTLKLPY